MSILERIVDKKTLSISISLFFFPLLVVICVFSLPLIIFCISTLYVIAWITYILLAQTDNSFNLPYKPARILKVNYWVLLRFWKYAHFIPLAITALYTKYIVLSASQFANAIKRDIPYVEHAGPLQTLDLYLPTNTDPTSPHPIIIFVHGGTWSNGSKKMYLTLANTLREMGYVVIVPDYRKYPQVKVEDCYRDIRSVVDWVWEHADQRSLFNGIHADKTKTYLMGHSAGAHLSSYVAFQEAIQKCHPNHKSNGASESFAQPRVEGLILMAGVYDIQKHHEWEAKRGIEKISPMARAMGKTDPHFLSNSPTHLVKRSASLFAHSPDLLQLFPRILFIHGERDETVPVDSTTEVYHALGNAIPQERRDEVDVRMRLYKKLGHDDCVTALMPNLFHQSRFTKSLIRDIQEFVEFNDWLGSDEEEETRAAR